VLKVAKLNRLGYAPTMSAVEIMTHIVRDNRGVMWIDDTNIKVIEVALDHVAYHWDAEEIHSQHPTLSRAQIHAALAFYYDHKEEFDQAIAASLARAERQAVAGEDSLVCRKLRASGRLS
jgi:uncharacterized protein (DUF433 family)